MKEVFSKKSKIIGTAVLTSNAFLGAISCGDSSGAASFSFDSCETGSIQPESSQTFFDRNTMEEYKIINNLPTGDVQILYRSVGISRTPESIPNMPNIEQTPLDGEPLTVVIESDNNVTARLNCS